MTNKTIQYKQDEGIATIMFDRPETLNAISKELLRETIDALNAAGADASVRVIVITGAGKSFMAGGDIKLMNAMTPLEFHDFCGEIQQLTRVIRDVGKPVIAAVNGWAMGGGCEIACACDIRIAAKNAKFALPEPKIGLTNTSGVCHLLPKIIGLGRAMEMVITGNAIDADEAYRIGLVNKVVDRESLEEAVAEMSRAIMRLSPIALRIARRTLLVCSETDLETSLHYEVESITTAFLTDDRKEGLSSFIEKRDPAFIGK